MSDDVSQVVMVNAPKLTDLEERLNAVLRDIPVEHVIAIDYEFNVEVYGLVAVVRYLVKGS